MGKYPATNTGYMQSVTVLHFLITLKDPIINSVEVHHTQEPPSRKKTQVNKSSFAVLQIQTCPLWILCNSTRGIEWRWSRAPRTSPWFYNARFVRKITKNRVSNANRCAYRKTDTADRFGRSENPGVENLIRVFRGKTGPAAQFPKIFWKLQPALK